MYKNIMLALDGSKISDSLVEEVTKLIKGRKGVNLRIIHVVDESFVYYGGQDFDYLSLIVSCQEAGQNILANAEKAISSQSPVKIETSLLELKPFHKRIAEVIVEEAKDWSADLLVIGTHGRRGFSHLLLGSVAENIIRIATTPILLVRSSEV